MTYLFDDKISYDDTVNLTAFGRLRVAQSRLLGEYRYMYGSSDIPIEMNDLVAGNGFIGVDHVRNCALANVGTATGDRVVRQTKQYHPYISGTSNTFYITFTANRMKTNLQQLIGAFDDYDGVFFRLNGNVPEFVIRKNLVDDQVIPQSAWNVDRLDGSMNEFNPSGIKIDFTKSQVLFLDFQWLGVGRVRIGFSIDGKPVLCHQFLNANFVTEVYMNQPSLPCRWEIKNVGATANASQLMAICAGAYCEGADSESGFTRSVSTGTSPVSVGAVSQGKGILGIRLKNSLAGKPNHALARLKNYSIVSTQDMQYKVVVLPGRESLANANVHWANVPGYSWCEYLTNFDLANTWSSANTFSCLDDNIVVGGQKHNNGSLLANESDNRSSAIYQNYDSSNSQILVIVGFRLATDASVSASVSWIEVK